MKLLKIDGSILIDRPELDNIKEVVKYCLENKVSLAESNLSRADLAEVNLAGADLAEANLYGANLAGAYLAGAYLAGAYLTGANLAGADLAGADLAGVNLYGVNLYGAKNIYIFNKKNGRSCYAIIFKDNVYIKAGCFWGTLDQFEKQALEKYGSDSVENYSLQINYLKTIKTYLNPPPSFL